MPYLPDEILEQEQFTGGGYNRLDSLVEHCNNSISDEEQN